MESLIRVSQRCAVVRLRAFVGLRFTDPTGAVAAEYAFLLALIAIVMVAGAVLVGSAIMNQLSAGAAAIGP